MNKQEIKTVQGINNLSDEVLSNAGQLQVLEYRIKHSNLHELTQEKARELIDYLLPVSKGAIFELTIAHEGRFTQASKDKSMPSLEQQIKRLLLENESFSVTGVRCAGTRDGNEKMVRFELKNFSGADIPELKRRWNEMVTENGRGIEPRFSLEIKHLSRSPA